MTRSVLAGITLAALTLAVPASEEGFVKLFNGKDLTGWKPFLADGADPAKTWTITDGVIRCTGKPLGYLITDKDYGDYVLRLQWRWPEKPGNSGVFVHVTGPDQIWPKGVEAQLQHGAAGDFWLVGDYKLTIPESQRDPGTARHFLRIGEFRKKSQDGQGKTTFQESRKSVEKPLGEWNQYEIICKGDEVRLIVNGQLVNVGTNAESKKGKILLQSEGAPIEFRNIEIKPLK